MHEPIHYVLNWRDHPRPGLFRMGTEVGYDPATRVHKLRMHNGLIVTAKDEDLMSEKEARQRIRLEAKDLLWKDFDWLCLSPLQLEKTLTFAENWAVDEMLRTDDSLFAIGEEGVRQALKNIVMTSTFFA